MAPDPDPRLLTTDFRIQITIRIRILQFFVSGWQDANKNKFFSKFLLITFTIQLHQSWKVKSQKEFQSSRNQEFSYFFACWWKDLEPNPDRYKWCRIQIYGMPKNIHIQQHCYCCSFLTDFHFPFILGNLSVRNWSHVSPAGDERETAWGWQERRPVL